MTDKTAKTIRQLFALALDKGASVGEIATSGQKIVEFLRREGTTVDELGRVFAPKTPPPVEASVDTTCLSAVIPFGKYRGMNVGWVLEHYPDYLDWMLENCHSLRPRLRQAIEEALENFSE